MMIQFDTPTGDIVMINPMLVRYVSKNHNDSRACLINFDGEDYVIVIGSIEDVGRQVSASQI